MDSLEFWKQLSPLALVGIGLVVVWRTYQKLLNEVTNSLFQRLDKIQESLDQLVMFYQNNKGEKT